MTDGDGAGGDRKDVGAVGGDDAAKDVRDGIHAQGFRKAGDDGDGNGGGSGIARELGEEGGKAAGDRHDGETAGEMHGGDEGGELLDRAGLDDEPAQSEAGGKEADHAPHDVRLCVFPCEHRMACLILQEEHEETEGEEDVGRLPAGEQVGEGRAGEGKDGRGKEEDEADPFAFLQRAEGLVHVLKVASCTLHLFHGDGDRPQEEKVHEENDRKQREEADDPVIVHEFASRELLDVGDSDEIGR